LAITLCTIAKNVALSAGACPAAAIRGMLKYFGHTASGSTVRAMIGLFVKFGVIRATSYAQPEHHLCRQWQVLLPDVVPFAELPAVETAVSPKAEPAKPFVPGPNVGAALLTLAAQVPLFSYTEYKDAQYLADNGTDGPDGDDGPECLVHCLESEAMVAA
jgi:hypothetical protein